MRSTLTVMEAAAEGIDKKMSRIGKSPITIPADVTVTVDGAKVSAKGKLGELSAEFSPTMKIHLSDGVLTVDRPNDLPPQRSLHGLTRSLLANMVNGVNTGYEKTLDMVGTGYRVEQKGNGLTLQIGYSHPVDVMPLADNELSVVGNNRIVVKGIDKQAVGEQAAQIRRIRRPNIYTGKGIKYADEQIKRKAGKAATGAAT